jgi:hypothetical protein
MALLAAHGNRGQESAMSAFQHGKFVVMSLTGLAKDALHIYVALIVFFGSCVLFRWKARDWKPWLLVLLAALAGEVMDLRDQAEFYHVAFKWGESVKDIVNTLMVPTMILLAARYSRLFRPD